MARRKTHAPAPGDPAQPAGANTALGKAFLRAVAADFGRNGYKTIRRLRRKRPFDYLEFVGALLPRLFVSANASLADITDDELTQMIATLRAGIAEKEQAGGGGEGGQEPDGAGH